MSAIDITLHRCEALVISTTESGGTSWITLVVIADGQKHEITLHPKDKHSIPISLGGIE